MRLFTRLPIHQFICNSAQHEPGETFKLLITRSSRRSSRCSSFTHHDVQIFITRSSRRSLWRSRCSLPDSPPRSRHDPSQHCLVFMKEIITRVITRLSTGLITRFIIGSIIGNSKGLTNLMTEITPRTPMEQGDSFTRVCTYLV